MKAVLTEPCKSQRRTAGITLLDLQATILLSEHKMAERRKVNLFEYGRERQAVLRFPQFLLRH